MKFAFDQDQIALQRTLRGFLESHQPLTGVRTAMTEGFDRQVWSRLANEVGVAAIGLPEESGGTGQCLLDQIVVASELGRAVDPGPFLSSVATVARILHETGSQAPATWLPDLLEGKRIAAAALWERDGGSTPSAAGTRADLHGDAWTVSGEKRFVLHADAADAFLVLASTEDGPTLFWVDSSAPGVEVRSLRALDQTRPLADVVLQDAPAELVGSIGGASVPLDAAWRRLMVLVAAEQLGGAERILELTTEYAITREQFGRPIGSFQSIKHMLATVSVEVEALRTLVLYAGWAFDRSEPDLDELAHSALAVAGDTFLTAAKTAIQVHGAIGFTWEHDAHLFLKRAMSTRQLFGTPQEHREAIASRILDDVG